MQHFSQEERYHICLRLKDGSSISEIARQLGRSKSSVSEEIRRNSGGRGYRPKQAGEKAESRWRQSHSEPSKMKGDLLVKIEELIRQDWSPEQISGRLCREDGISVHHETIYRYILSDKSSGGSLWKHLRRANRRNKKRYGSFDSRGKISNRRDIDERPESAENRQEVGHWEGDTVKDGERERSIVTLVERKTRFTVMMAVPSLHADTVSDAIVTGLSGISGSVTSITFDNGREFAGHQKLSKALGCDIYFAKPYHSWERGTNENTNGLIRQYYPKRQVKFERDTIEVVEVEAKLNNRPRKVLGFATPLEAFKKETGINLEYQLN